MWIVTLVKPPLVNLWREGWFPRKFKDKAGAEALKKDVEAKGGRAFITKEK